MKTFIITLWLACGMAVSLAETRRWQNVDDLISWLQSKKELELAEYRDAGGAFAHFRYKGGLDFKKEETVDELIAALAFRRFAKLREARDFQGVSEIVEADYATTLKLRIMAALADGKDEEFSARVLYHAIDSRTWTLPPKGFDPVYNEARQELFDKLVGNPKTTAQKGTIDSTDGRQAVKKALEEKWPILLKEPAEVREKKPPAQEIPENAITGAHSDKDLSGNPEARDDNGAPPWLIGILTLMAGAFAIVFIKSRRGMRK